VERDTETVGKREREREEESWEVAEERS